MNVKSYKDNVTRFNQDLKEEGRYKYTGEKLSARIANERITQFILESTDFKDKRVIDAGCGDGTYTQLLVKIGGAKEVVAFDPCKKGIEFAKSNHNYENKINFTMCDSDDFLAGSQDRYDITVFRGVLHHIQCPEKAIANAIKWSDKVVILEPNGYSPILKLIEIFSKYHRDHGERSYGFARLNKWIKQAGGKVIYHKRAGIVPYFCPDWMAKSLKFIEPFFEKIPVINVIYCTVDVIVYEKSP